MFAKKSASQEELIDFDAGESSELTERGCYGQALREGRVRQPRQGASRTVNMLLWVLNIVGWLLAAAFIAWRFYAIYFVEGT
jgi:hypothetical protein